MAIQTTSGSRREKWVAAFIPAVAILLVTFFYISFYADPQLRKVESQYDSAVRSGVTPDILAKLDWDVKQLSDERTELQRTIRSVDDEVTAKSGAFQRLSPTAKQSAVTALCREHGVAILQDQMVKEIRLPALRQKSFEALQSLVPKDAINFRELTLAADYATIATVLKKLPEIPGVIPVSMTLKKSTVTDSSGDSRNPTVTWTVGLLM